MIKTVGELRMYFAENIKFWFYDKSGTPQEKAKPDDKIDFWLVTEDFKVVVVVK